MTLAEAVEQIWLGDCGRSLVPIDDRDKFAVERLAFESRELSLPTRSGPSPTRGSDTTEKVKVMRDLSSSLHWLPDLGEGANWIVDHSL